MVRCVMSVSITLKRSAYERLKKLKEPGDSFSDVIDRELPERCATGADVEAFYSKHGVPKVDASARKRMLQGRGRRSKR